MQPNIELMDRVIEYIRLNPEQHDQASFGRQTECGSAHCFGGWAVVLEDGTESLVWGQDGWPIGVMVSDRRWDIVERANVLLGIDGWEEMEHLFSNSRIDTYGYDCEEDEDCCCSETIVTNPSLYDEINSVDDLAERVEYYRSMVTCATQDTLALKG